MKLNIGCGVDLHQRYINVDIIRNQYSCPQVVADACDLPFRSNLFLEVLAGHVIEHIPADRHHTFLSEIHRVLMPAGSCMIAYPIGGQCGNKHRYDIRVAEISPPVLSSLCLEVGLIVLDHWIGPVGGTLRGQKRMPPKICTTLEGTV